MDNSKESQLKDAFDAHLNMFLKNGHPISFGRMEAIKECAEILGLSSLLDHIQTQILKHDKELSAMCG